MLFQTCMTFFLLLSKKIFWRILITKFLVPIDFHCIDKTKNGHQWEQKLFGYQQKFNENIFQNIFFYVPQQEKAFWVWNNMRVNIFWQNCYYWVDNSRWFRIKFIKISFNRINKSFNCLKTRQFGRWERNCFIIWILSVCVAHCKW